VPDAAGHPDDVPHYAAKTACWTIQCGQCGHKWQGSGCSLTLPQVGSTVKTFSTAQPQTNSDSRQEAEHQTPPLVGCHARKKTTPDVLLCASLPRHNTTQHLTDAWELHYYPTLWSRGTTPPPQNSGHSPTTRGAIPHLQYTAETNVSLQPITRIEATPQLRATFITPISNSLKIIS
jgi:hypothetical protein